MIIAGIDVHKRVLMVVVGRVGSSEYERICFESRRFGTTTAELLLLVARLKELGVEEVVMESTAQYWKPVWLTLEPHFRLRLAQAWSNRAPRAKKTDYKDAQRLVRRYAAGELSLSFVAEADQRLMRDVMRRRRQLTQDRVRVQAQVESLLEETRIKLSSVVSDLFGATGLRILTALAAGESDPEKLAALADERIKCPPARLVEALTGVVTSVHRSILRQHLDQLRLIDGQMEELAQLAAEMMKEHSAAITRLVKVPGIRVLAAQQIIAEVGVDAKAFASAAQFASWAGVCPGREESAGENHSGRCAKGNKFLRHTLCQVAQAAVRTNNSCFQQKLRSLMPRLGYAKAIWAIAHRLAVVIWKILHDGAEYIEHGSTTTAQATKRRIQRVRKELKALGFSDQLTPLPSRTLQG